MKKRTIMGIMIFLAMLPSIFAECDITSSTYWVMEEGSRFNYDMNSTGVFSWAPLNISLSRFDVSRHGVVSYVPRESGGGMHDFLAISTTEDGCYSVKRIRIRVYTRPDIHVEQPSEEYIEIEEAETILFKINATTVLKNKELKYTWLRNDRIVGNGEEYVFRTNFSDAGTHYITAVVEDTRGLNETQEWVVRVGNRNRRPYLHSQMPTIIVTHQTDGEIMSLYNYIIDPDRDRLDFEILFGEGNQTSKIFNATVDEKGILYIKTKAEIYLKQPARVKATDPGGLSIIADEFIIRLATDEDKFTFFEEISDVDECEPNIQCLEWSECFPENLRTRECFDVNECNTQNATFVESEQCDYDATCFDNILNQGEDLVDCGGPCEACPTCEDEIQNQGEEGVDCGGPCDPCPTCFDNILNQGESDIDCGGPCVGCAEGYNCTQHLDCDSNICTDYLCAGSTCYDFRQNQGEEGIDCGGPCDPCPSCTDNEQNQGEEGVDCGGPCKACITCDDGIRNQGELFTDCGGPCDACGAIVFLVKIKSYILVGVPILVVIIVGLIIRSKYSRDKIKFLRDLGKMTGFMTGSIDASTIKFINAVNSLNQVKHELFSIEDKNKIANDYKSTIDQFFVDLLKMEGTISRGVLRSKLKSSVHNPFIVGMFLEIYDYSRHVSPAAPLFKIEMNEKIDNTIRILNSIREVV